MLWHCYQLSGVQLNVSTLSEQQQESGLPHWRIGGFQRDVCVRQGGFDDLGIVLKLTAPPNRVGLNTLTHVDCLQMTKMTVTSNEKAKIGFL